MKAINIHAFWYDFIIFQIGPLSSKDVLISVYKMTMSIVLLICCRIFGDYESLKGGQAKDAMVDMTGGVGEALELKDYTKTEEDKLKLFKILRKCKEHHSLISAAIPVIL